MAILPRLLLLMLLIVAPAVIWAISGRLPFRVATHFGAGGNANRWTVFLRQRFRDVPRA